jgi:hypothetical protein
VAGDPKRASPFDRPRIYAAFTLTVSAAVLSLIDALSKDYVLSDTTLGLLIFGAGSLLGVEGLSMLRRKD